MRTTGQLQTSRRGLLKTGGALVVSIGVPLGIDVFINGPAHSQDGALAVSTNPALAPDQLSSYIAVNGDGTVSAFFGKIDVGHGLSVAIAQIIAEELDVPFDAVKVVMGDTATSVNMGGASSSNGVSVGGKQMRFAAAEARRLLLQMAGQKMSAPVDSLTVSEGVVRHGADKISYADLVGNEYFNVVLEWNKLIGNPLFAPGKGKPKDPASYKIVGASVKRKDVAPKVYAQLEYVTDIRRPGMMHGRMIRPQMAGAVPVKIDETSIKEIPGARAIWQEGFLGVVAEREWDAVRASRLLKVQWSESKPALLDSNSLYDYLRRAPARKSEFSSIPSVDSDNVFQTAARVVEAEYEWPFQSHASMGPGCAVVEINDGQATCWTGDQKPHNVRDGVAAILGLAPEKVRAIWLQGSGSYGRNDAGDAASDAAVLAQAVGRPVRVQYLRADATGWDPKGPASVHHARAAIGPDNSVIGYEFISRGFSGTDVNSNAGNPRDTLAGQLRGIALQSGDSFSTPGENYTFPNVRLGWETVAPLLDRASPLRTSHLRDPMGPQVNFASESFIDEVAHALGQDPIAFRLRYISDQRDTALIRAVTRRAQWQQRLPTKHGDQSAVKVSGRGFAFANRGGTRVAVIADIELDRKSGEILVRKFFVAHDCGLIINPDSLRRTIEGNVVQGLSRAIWEEVKFNAANVTSNDWITYPVLDIAHTPETIDIVLINQPDLPPSGAGEPSTRPIAAAIANAVFDATGIRIRRAPLTRERIREALT